MKYLKIAGVLILILALIGSWAYFLRNSAEKKLDISHSSALIRFTQTHGTAKMTNFMNPEELYFATWETDTHVGMSLYVDGIWVIIGTQEKPKAEEKK